MQHISGQEHDSESFHLTTEPRVAARHPHTVHPRAAASLDCHALHQDSDRAGARGDTFLLRLSADLPGVECARDSDRPEPVWANIALLAKSRTWPRCFCSVGPL